MKKKCFASVYFVVREPHGCKTSTESSDVYTHAHTHARARTHTHTPFQTVFLVWSVFMVIFVLTSAPFAVIILSSSLFLTNVYKIRAWEVWFVLLIQYCLGYQLRITGWSEHIPRVGARRGLCKVLIGKTERPRHRWVDNIKMDLKEVQRGGMDWIDVAQVRDRWRALVNAVMYLRVP